MMGALILVSNLILAGLVLWLAVEWVLSVGRSREARIPEPVKVRPDPPLR